MPHRRVGAAAALSGSRGGFTAGALLVGSVAVIAVIARSRSASAPVAQSGSPEADLAIEYRLISRMPTCRGNHRVRIDRDGAVYAATNVSDCRPGESWSTPFPAQATRRLTSGDRGGLQREIDASGVLTMPLNTDQGTVADGVVEEIEITRGRDRRTIRVVNASPPPFLRARAAILRAAGEAE